MESGNRHVQILNSDLTYFSRLGSGNGHFQQPRDVAFDRTGNVYVTDFSNHRIQVFTSEGQFLRQFAVVKGSGKLKHPTGISIDSENIV